MNSNFFYDNVLLAVFVGLVILAVALAVNYFRKPTYKNQPDIVVHKADFSSLNTQLEKELTQARTELTTCQAERENYKGLWEQSVERGKVLNAEITSLESQLDFGNETIKWMKADLKRAYSIIKEYELILGIKEPFIPEILSKENIQKAMDKTVAEFIQPI